MAEDDTTKQATAQQEMFQAILDVTGWKVPAVPAGRIGKLASALRQSGGCAADLRERFGMADPGNGWWYYRDTWQGRAGGRPNEKAIREYWLAWTLPIAVTPAVARAAEPAGFDALRQFVERHNAHAD